MVQFWFSELSRALYKRFGKFGVYKQHDVVISSLARRDKTITGAIDSFSQCTDETEQQSVQESNSLKSLGPLQDRLRRKNRKWKPPKARRVFIFLVSTNTTCILSAFRELARFVHSSISELEGSIGVFSAAHSSLHWHWKTWLLIEFRQNCIYLRK